MIATPLRIVLVDDDPTLCDALRDCLQQDGFDVLVLHQADLLLRQLEGERPHLVVLGQTQAGLVATLSRLRTAHPQIPLIALTDGSAGTDCTERIVCLELGADDCLDKPPHPKELRSRIKTVLRRSGVPTPLPPESREPLSFGRYTFDFRSRKLRHGREELSLPAGEFALLEIFLSRPMHMLTRIQLVKMLHHHHADGYLNRSVDVLVWRLRKHLEPTPSSPRFIQTVRNAGYVFVPNAQHQTNDAAGPGHR